MKISNILLSLAGLAGLAVAAPAPSTLGQPVVFDPVTRTISPAVSIDKRVNPIEQVGKIYRDGNGVTRAIFVLQMSEELLQAFESSGFNLAKAVLSEILQFGRDNNFAQVVRRNLWNAEFNREARILSGATYMSLAITSRGSVTGVTGATLLLQSWFESGQKYFAVEEVANALSHLTRSVSAREEDGEEVFPTKFCQAPIHGLFNLAVNRPAQPVDMPAGCPVDNS